MNKINENRTRPHEGKPEAFLGGVSDAERQADCRALARLMREITGEEPKMWGPWKLP